MSSAKINKMLIEIIMVLFPTMIATIPFGAGNFILPPQGGGVIHQDLNMSENLWYTCPTQNVGQLWYQDDLENLGAIAGTMGNGIVGNGHIAANSFGPFSFSGCKLRPNDKLLLFDYFGNILWRSGAWNLLLERGEFNYSLNPYATASSPMIDIHNRVVACDSERIILVNASDLNHITVDWVTNLTKLSSQNLRNRTVPFSPCPVGNHSFILPTHNGPVYLFDTDTGTPLANITLGKNTTLGEFWGIPKMNISDFLKIHTDFILHGISPFQYNSTSGRIEWNSEIPYGIMPLKRNHFIDYIHGKAFFYEENTVTYKERVSPFNWTIIASNEIQAPQICTEEGYFSTINSACVDGNKVYLATEYTMPDFSQYKVYNLSSGVNSTIGRLYAINVTPNAINESDRLVELWNYTYIGKSQATPTLINDTIYFDGYNKTILATNQDPHIYAIRTDGTEKWKRTVDGVTTFTMTTDPRGGIWYEDADQWPWRPFDGNNKLFRYHEEDGSYYSTSTIDIKSILNDSNHPFSKVIPSSDMTICGTPTYPIMLISANHPRFQEGKWVLAINLTTKTQIWNISVPPYTSNLNLPWPYINHSLGDFNYAVGDYTILQWHNQSRILFPTYPGGMMAIGQYPNCSFETINYLPKNTFIEDPGNDAVQVNFTIDSIIPDRAVIKATLISSEHPILCKYKTECCYDVIIPAGIQNNLTNILPPRAPKGNYTLQVDLYNSSGNMSFPRRTNETYHPDEQIYLAPPITPPETPTIPHGGRNVTTNTFQPYTTHTIDTNNLSIWYQWRYQTRNQKNGEFRTRYTAWILGGPHQSGENCTRDIIWSFPGTYNVSVRAKNVFLNPNVMSNWSDNLTVNVTYSNGGGTAWNPDILDSFSMDTVAVGQQTSCNGFAQGVVIDPSHRDVLNWTWDFNDGNYSYEQNPTHLYTSVEDYTITLTVQDDDGGINSVSRKVFDLVAPEFSNITSFPECQISGGFVNLSALVTDNVMVDDVYVNILHPDMVVENISITQNKTGDIYYCNNTYQQSGIYVYHIWANDISGNTNISGSYIFLINNPPVFLVPSPVNNSINNPLSFIWSIPISDPEGDLFSWTIQCSNTQTNSGTGATNGTKTLSLSGLTYSTTHKVWVNATDPTGSNQYTRAWYTFTTEAQNFPPVFGTPTPVNGSTNQPLIFNWSIPINDPEGDLFSWTIQCSNGQNSNGTGETNGTKTLALLLPFDSVYTVWVNATDPDGSGNYTRAWYWFTTKANLPPVFGSSNPANGSINQPLSFTWSIPINDSEGDLFSWTIQCSNEQTNSGTGASNGTKSLTLSGLAYLTTYKVWVNATDPTGSGLYTRRCYTFTTQQQQNEPPNKPNKPSGETNGKINTLYTYSTSTTDPNGDQVSYKWDWGDGTQSNWLGPYNSGITINTTHTWTKKGNYGIKVKAKDIYNAESNWSDPLPITMPYSYNNPIQQFFKMLIERFPNMFPILRHLLRY